jgi:uncharacterized damage-inducible protein DinB
MSFLTPMVEEMAVEADTTSRVLERVPRDRLDWRPHPKSFTIGELAIHVATVTRVFAQILAEEYVDFTEYEFTRIEPSPELDLVALMNESVADAREWLESVDEDQANGIWRGAVAGEEVVAVPRIAAIRSMLLSHWYHHRGQLTVYLRLLDIPVPAIYGPSADDNPFSPQGES